MDSKSEKNPGELVDKIAFGIMGVGVLIILIQAGVWFYKGFWPEVPIILLFIKTDWAIHPTKWLGVHEMLREAPLSLAMIVLGFVMLLRERN